MKIEILSILGTFSLLSSQLSFAHGVTNAKASELILHRVERLVILCNLGDANQPVNLPGSPGYDSTKCKNDPNKPKRGIEPSYQNKLVSLTMELIPHDEEDEPSFRGTAFQSPAADGTQKSVVITLDEEGRAVGKEVENAGGEPSDAFVWPDKDVTTLAENALHFVIDGAGQPEIAPYSRGLTRFNVSPGTNSNGILVAVVDMKITDQEPILRVRIRPNGDLDSHEFIQ